jgi:hypothetical protein
MRRIATRAMPLVAALVLTGCVGWVDDPPGDPTWNPGRAGAPPQEELQPYTDLVHLGADVTKQTTRLYARVLTTVPAPVDVAITWNTHGGGAEDHSVLLQWFTGGPTRWQATGANPYEPLCTGDGAFNGGEYSAAVPTSCLGDPTALTVTAIVEQVGARTGASGWSDDSASTPVIPAS